MALIYQSCLKKCADLSAELVARQDPRVIYETFVSDQFQRTNDRVLINAATELLVINMLHPQEASPTGGQPWREETLARRETFPRWRSASRQRQHITGIPFTNAMLCKTEQAKIISHTFSGVYSSVPPAGPRRRHLPFSNPKQLHPCACVHTIEFVLLLCSRACERS